MAYLPDNSVSFITLSSYIMWVYNGYIMLRSNIFQIILKRFNFDFILSLKPHSVSLATLFQRSIHMRMSVGSALNRHWLKTVIIFYLNLNVGISAV